MVQAELLRYLINRRSGPQQVQRGHQNSLETLPLFLVQMMFVGLRMSVEGIPVICRRRTVRSS